MGISCALFVHVMPFNTPYAVTHDKYVTGGTPQVVFAIRKLCRHGTRCHIAPAMATDHHHRCDLIECANHQRVIFPRDTSIFFLGRN